MNEELNTIENEPQEEAHIPVIQQLALLGIIMLLIFGTGFAPKLFSKDENTFNSAAVDVLDTEENGIAPPPVTATAENSLSEIRVTAEAAFVWDVAKQRVLYEKSPDEQLPLASITKLMTALVAHELVRSDENIPVTLSAIKQDGSSGFRDGETFTLESLTDLTLISSSNDGAFAIAAAAGALLDDNGDAGTFVEAMNIRADELGLTQTYFRNPTGLDISEEEAGAYGSARDVAFLMEYILTHEPAILEQTTAPTLRLYNEDGAYHSAQNTNPAISDIAGLIGSKTGYTELAGGNLAVAFDAAPNRPVVVVVLKSTRNERFSDVTKLVNAVRRNVE